MRFANNALHDTSKVLRLPRKMTMVTGHVQSPATKTATHLLKTSQKYCACHTKRLSTRYKARLNVTKCHACHAKRSNETLETSKSDHLCRAYHICTAIRGSHERLRTVATVNATSSEQTLNPCRPAEWNGNPCYAFGKKRGFAASPIDTARPQENQRLETRHVGASKEAFRARFPPIFTLCSFSKSTFSDEFL